MPLWARVLILLIALFIVTLAAMGVHLSIMEGALTFERRPVIEAANYAVQTVTTVGYGNWVPPSVEQAAQHQDANAQDKILRMKGFSVVFMLAGGALFAASVGVINELALDGAAPVGAGPWPTVRRRPWFRVTSLPHTMVGTRLGPRRLAPRAAGPV